MMNARSADSAEMGRGIVVAVAAGGGATGAADVGSLRTRLDAPLGPMTTAATRTAATLMSPARITTQPDATNRRPRTICRMPLALDGLLSVVFLVFWLYCLFDVITADPASVRNLPKLLWVVIVVLLFALGGVLWFLLGR